VIGHPENRVVEESSDEDHVEDCFGQLWSIPNSPERARASNQGSHLMWVRRDIVKSCKIKSWDYFPVGRHERIVDKPKIVSFSRGI
jgi:hypothetical protein